MSLRKNILNKNKRNSNIIDDIKVYISQHYDLLKLELLEKSSKILTVIFSMIVVVICCSAIVIYFSFALIAWLNKLLQNPQAGYLIVGGLFIVILIIILACKNRLFLNPLIKRMSNILFDNDKNNFSDDIDDRGKEDETK